MTEIELSYKELLALAKLKKEQEHITDGRNCKRVVIKYETEPELEFINQFKIYFNLIKNNPDKITKNINQFKSMINNLNKLK